MKIYIGTDHRGIDVEKNIVSYLKNNNHEVIESRIEHSDADDYVDFAKDVALNVVNNENSVGILICGTGIGMSIAANKIKGIRAARCVSVEDAYYTRLDNDANVLCLGARLEVASDINKCKKIVQAFLYNEFGAGRHERRVNKIIALENGE